MTNVPNKNEKYVLVSPENSTVQQTNCAGEFNGSHQDDSEHGESFAFLSDPHSPGRATPLIQKSAYEISSENSCSRIIFIIFILFIINALFTGVVTVYMFKLFIPSVTPDLSILNSENDVVPSLHSEPLNAIPTIFPATISLTTEEADENFKSTALLWKKAYDDMKRMVDRQKMRYRELKMLYDNSDVVHNLTENEIDVDSQIAAMFSLSRRVQPSQKAYFNQSEKIVFYGIFSTAEKVLERQLVRKAFASQLQSFDHAGIRFEYKFILGNNEIRRAGREEMWEHKDMIILPIAENMNQGKTYYYFNEVARRMGSGNLNALIFKADHDTFLCLETFLGMAANIAVNHNQSYQYIGRINTRRECGTKPWCPPPDCTNFKNGCYIYMSGGMYGLSLPLVRMLMAEDQIKTGPEDAFIAQWIQEAKLSDEINLFHFHNGKHWCHGNESLWLQSSIGPACNPKMHYKECDK